jgi:hypothetical protein
MMGVVDEGRTSLCTKAVLTTAQCSGIIIQKTEIPTAGFQTDDTSFRLTTAAAGDSSYVAGDYYLQVRRVPARAVAVW